MNITGTYPTISNLTKTLNRDINKQLLTNSTWTAVYFLYLKYYNNTDASNTELQLLKLSLNTIIHEIPTQEIILYVLDMNSNIGYLTMTLSDYMPSISIRNLVSRQEAQLSIIHNLLRENVNLLVLNHMVGCINGCGNMITTQLNNEQDIYSDICDQSQYNLAYVEIGKKFGITNFIDSRFMIIPSTETSKMLFEKASEMAKALTLNNNDTMINNIALTVVNTKCGGIVKNTNQIENYSYLVRYQYDIHTKNILSELNILYGTNIKWRSVINKNYNPNLELTSDFNKLVLYETINAKISYTRSDLLYYPYLDIKDHNKTVMNSTSILFNTNGFSYNPTKYNSTSIHANIYKRFTRGNSGLFVKKIDTHIPIIPKIFHYIWLEDTEDVQLQHIDTYQFTPQMQKIMRDIQKSASNSTHQQSIGKSKYVKPVIANKPQQTPNYFSNYFNAWKLIFNSSWKVEAWTRSRLDSEFSNSRWYKLYSDINFKSFQNLIVKMMLIESYGGIMVSGFYTPSRLIPDDLLFNSFVISYENEYIDMSLNYDIMMSIKNHSITDVIYHTITTNLDQLSNKFIITNNITVMPSYYFNKIQGDMPRYLEKMNICNYKQPTIPMNYANMFESLQSYDASNIPKE